ncbi:MAG: acyltransferase [Candidatus Eremiobacteraeota bacterium]|nr:acyltransferase [Candidatus Eremiobacteraeota bacterium]
MAFHLLFIHNWFASTYGTIDGVMWSLGVEVQFYVLFPLIAFAFVRMPLVTAATLTGVANGWRIWALHAGHYFLGQREAQLPAFIDVFAIGMLCAFVYAALARRDHLPVRPVFFGLLMLAGCAAFWLLVSGAFAIRYTPDWPEPWKVAWRTCVGLSFGAAALGSLFAPRALQRVLANPPLLFLAAISYNLYLWHQPIAWMLVAHRIPPFRGSDPHHDRAWMVAFWFVAIPAALVVSTLVTYALERPLLRLGRRRRTRAAVATERPARALPTAGR